MEILILHKNIIFPVSCQYLFKILQPQAREKAEKEGYKISVAKTSFKANSKALAENEGEGLAKVAFLNLYVSGNPFVDIYCQT